MDEKKLQKSAMYTEKKGDQKSRRVEMKTGKEKL